MKVQKWGNSLGIRIPGPFAEQLNIIEGSDIEVLLLEGEIVLRPIRLKPTLEELLAGITPENRHDEINFGKSEGNELL
jgi:antitoxin MazE